MRLVWVNSPGNPTGRVLPAEHLRKVVDWARCSGAPWSPATSATCELGWEARAGLGAVAPCAAVATTGVLAVHSLSKRSNLAGYRAGFVAGDPALVGGAAGGAQARRADRAGAGAGGDGRGARRRGPRRRSSGPVTAPGGSTLRAAVVGAGFTVDHSEAGLYLWVTRGEDCWATVDWLADRGILAAPGVFYGPAGAAHVRVALTASDERIAAAATRLAA